MSRARPSVGLLLGSSGLTVLLMAATTCRLGAREQPEVGNAPAQTGGQTDAAGALSAAERALGEVLTRVGNDGHLKPKEGQAVKVSRYPAERPAEVSLRYETPDAWPDLPSKPAGPRPGHGSVWVRVLRGPAKTSLDAPFQPPRHCHYALSMYGTSVPDVKVSVWSMARDQAAHGRLEALVRARLQAAGIVMEAKPLAPPVRASGPSSGGSTPPGPAPATAPKAQPAGQPHGPR